MKCPKINIYNKSNVLKILNSEYIRNYETQSKTFFSDHIPYQNVFNISILCCFIIFQFHLLVIIFFLRLSLTMQRRLDLNS